MLDKLSDHNSSALTGRAERSTPLTHRRALVVEDETLVLMMLEDMLTDLGCESIATAATVDKALALINTQVFDVAILDVNLHGNTSSLVAESLLARGIPFAFCTGNYAHKSTDADRKAPVLKKPFKQEELAEILTRLL